MAWELKADGGGVTLTFTDHFSLEDMADAARASDDLIEATGATHRIADFRAAKPLQLSLDDVHGLARLLSAGTLSLAGGRDAIVGARAVFAGNEETYEYMISK